ncbi:hypothetical protein COB21_00555 [Candidatus Aerophobetes bacterium]|uniref:Uncharacterized protein n=1 Tax=Aerophobetes bacterium TaxID=2030807 RepID=A0A2A4X7P7_UNCAE|nr:MAG: hypothetical protein COB21_00555 [Candidatus Aerophobetes bacterium]
MDTKLTKKEAFQAMKNFIELHYLRTSQNDEIGILLGACKQNPRTGEFLKPIMWDYWLESIDKIKPKELRK